MDKIIISELEVFYHVGITEGERSQPQRLLLTVEMAHDFKAAAARDNLAETVDYAAVSERLLQSGEDSHWEMMETLAADLAVMILERFSPRQVSLEVKKFFTPQAGCVAVSRTRPH